MQAAVFEAVGTPIEVGDVDLRGPGPREVLVRIAACGVCHSDLSVVDGSFPSPLPVVLGHEAAGVVEEVGADVTSVAPGDKVVLTPLPPCGNCYFCTRGQPTLCATWGGSLFTSLLADGTSPFSRGGEIVYRGLATAAWAEQAIMPEEGVVKVDDDVPLETACVLGCAVQTGVGAVLNTARVEEGATVLVLGAGGIGIAVTQGARLAAASRIIVSDPVAERREAALRFGATDVIDPADADPVVAAFELTARHRGRLLVRGRGPGVAHRTGDRGDPQRRHDRVRRRAAARPGDLDPDGGRRSRQRRSASSGVCSAACTPSGTSPGCSRSGAVAGSTSTA